MLRVRKRDVLAGRERGLGREDVTAGHLARVDQLRHGDRPELDELDLRQPVDLLEAEQAGDPLVALGIAPIRQVRHLLQVADRLQPVLRRRPLQHGERVAVVERRLPEQRGAVLLLVGFRRGVVLRQSLRRRRVPEDERDHARVLRVEVDLAALLRGVDQLRAADVLLVGHLEALRLEGLLVELAKDVLLGEVLRADRDRRRGGLRVRRPA